MDHKYISNNPVPSSKNEKRGLTKLCRVVSAEPEDKMFSHDDVTLIRRDCKRVIKTSKDYNSKINAYAKLVSSFSACRIGEIPPLRWSDIKDTVIHIHAEQILDKAEGRKAEYIIVDYTKDEKGISRGGRKLELTTPLIHLLNEIKALQGEYGIESDYIFCDTTGAPITKKCIEDSLYKQCKRLKINLTNNHAFRIYINSYVLIPMGIPAPNRAKILGHSVETNLRNYSYAVKDLAEARATIVAFYGEEADMTVAEKESTAMNAEKLNSAIDESLPDDVTRCNPETIPFPTKRKSRKTL